jgi:hypothetical protein
VHWRRVGCRFGERLGNVCLDAIWREDGCRSGVKQFGIFSSDCADE